MPIVFAKALILAQGFQLLFGALSALAVTLQLNDQPFLFCEAALSLDYVAFDLPQLIEDRAAVVHRRAPPQGEPLCSV
ncbi:hypothetical protein [Bradyrhizobium japonicum]|uniref:hypothetical protein n=1 Tax=Bradyrhizobium japonicum TaxID=375 RepID=UPI001E4EBC95|nr:hypothetical protein [Bradyrhizobium japonicum]MCD9817678.1 hypothetical protein [Bradyrhizobium japonicum]MEB2672479.1 hypothetical protein [Bradyrhizobium japonicum]WRI91740.1 hypothetical protein R3F75_12765 [Bradyrhizobium japonicum]